MKVLQIVDNLGMGGAEVWLVALLRHWQDQDDGPQVHFLATGGQEGVLDDAARSLGAKIHYLRYSQARLPVFARAFRRLLEEGRYDAIHDHQDYASGWHFALGTGLLPPVRITHVHNPVYQVQENYGNGLRKRLTGAVGKRFVAHYATYIAGTSRQAISEHGFDAPAFDRVPKGPVYCGFDTGQFSGHRPAARASVRQEFGWQQRTRIVLFAGRIDVSPRQDHPRAHKNSGFAASIAIEACRRDPDLHVLFAGSPSAGTPILEGRIAEASLSGRIRLLGVRADVPRLMLASEVLLFPSRGEGLGMVAVEAQAAGTPVLASTAVPRECVVVPELVTFLDLDAGVDRWATDLLRLARSEACRGGANAAVSESAFAISNSARTLVALYAGHR
ncbi:glycosyltransferase [Microbaculum marinum]|uniref:Glycosyltransferase n=1 Tax=Microbaculum marinum TaxID=1764581 RepID=A0AAW9RY25_9HYPH